MFRDGQKAHDIDNSIFLCGINSSTLFSTVYQSNEIDIIRGLKIKIKLPVVKDVIGNCMNRSYHTMVDSKTVVIKMYLTVMFALFSFYPFNHSFFTLPIIIRFF